MDLKSNIMSANLICKALPEPEVPLAVIFRFLMVWLVVVVILVDFVLKLEVRMNFLVESLTVRLQITEYINVKKP